MPALVFAPPAPAAATPQYLGLRRAQRGQPGGQRGRAASWDGRWRGRGTGQSCVAAPPGEKEAPLLSTELVPSMCSFAGRAADAFSLAQYKCERILICMVMHLFICYCTLDLVVAGVSRRSAGTALAGLYGTVRPVGDATAAMRPATLLLHFSAADKKAVTHAHPS